MRDYTLACPALAIWGGALAPRRLVPYRRNNLDSQVRYNVVVFIKGPITSNYI